MRIGGLCKRLDTRWMGISGSEKEGNNWLDWLNLVKDCLSICVLVVGLKDLKDVPLIVFARHKLPAAHRT